MADYKKLFSWAIAKILKYSLLVIIVPVQSIYRQNGTDKNKRVKWGLEPLTIHTKRLL